MPYCIKIITDSGNLIFTLQIVFDYPSEILTHITGYYGPAMIMGPEVIKSLIFHTTKGKYGPYGEEGGTYFSTNLKERMMIVGFHGRKGLFIDAIGFHVIEGKAVPASIPSSKSSYHNAVPTKSKNKIPTSNSASMSNNHTSLLKNKAEIPQWFSKIGKQSQTGEVPCSNFLMPMSKFNFMSQSLLMF